MLRCKTAINYFSDKNYLSGYAELMSHLGIEWSHNTGTFASIKCDNIYASLLRTARPANLASPYNF